MSAHAPSHSPAESQDNHGKQKKNASADVTHGREDTGNRVRSLLGENERTYYNRDTRLQYKALPERPDSKKLLKTAAVGAAIVAPPIAIPAIIGGAAVTKGWKKISKYRPFSWIDRGVKGAASTVGNGLRAAASTVTYPLRLAAGIGGNALRAGYNAVDGTVGEFYRDTREYLHHKLVDRMHPETIEATGERERINLLSAGLIGVKKAVIGTGRLGVRMVGTAWKGMWRHPVISAGGLLLGLGALANAGWSIPTLASNVANAAGSAGHSILKILSNIAH